jgi:hypothetical protein
MATTTSFAPPTVSFSGDIVACALSVPYIRFRHVLPRASLTTWLALREELGRVWRLDPALLIFRGGPSSGFNGDDGPQEHDAMAGIDLLSVIPDDVRLAPQHGDVHFFLGYALPKFCPICAKKSILGYGRAFNGDHRGDPPNANGFFGVGNLDNYGGSVVHLYWPQADSRARMACGACIKAGR